MMKTESAVKERYSGAAKAPEAALCCPVEYDARYLKITPQGVIEKDYGCFVIGRFTLHAGRSRIARGFSARRRGRG